MGVIGKIIVIVLIFSAIGFGAYYAYNKFGCKDNGEITQFCLTTILDEYKQKAPQKFQDNFYSTIEKQIDDDPNAFIYFLKSKLNIINNKQFKDYLQNMNDEYYKTLG